MLNAEIEIYKANKQKEIQSQPQTSILGMFARPNKRRKCDYDRLQNKTKKPGQGND